MPLMRTFSPDEEEARAALAEQEVTLSKLSDKGVGHPDFINWKTLTEKVLERYLPGSALSARLKHGFAFPRSL